MFQKFKYAPFPILFFRKTTARRKDAIDFMLIPRRKFRPTKAIILEAMYDVNRFANNTAERLSWTSHLGFHIYAELRAGVLM